MINFRRNPIDGKDNQIEFVEGETLKEVVTRAIEEMAEGVEVDETTLKAFRVTVNGHILDYEHWETLEVKEDDNILIVPAIRGGDFGQILSTAIIIGAAALTAGALAPALGGIEGLAFIGTKVGTSLLTAGVTFGTTLLVRALIPPPEAGLGLGTGPSPIESSQMYTITSQSNSVKKYQNVPKVYGYHRVFPNIAANPYTTIENDPVTGKLVQYFHAIYDFGLGPHVVDNIRIGDTKINSYSDARYRLVDPNRPTVDEGTWDKDLFDSFEIYKGDNEKDSTRVVLNEDASPTLSQDSYRVLRQTSANVQGDRQEVILDFVCPQGLYALATNGSIFRRNIDLKIEFRKFGSTKWRPFNDLEVVDSFKSVGGDDQVSKRVTIEAILREDRNNPAYYDLLSSYRGWEVEDFYTYPPDVYYETHGFEKGRTTIVHKGILNRADTVGASLFSDKDGFLGVITGVTTLSGPITIVFLDRPLKKDIAIYLDLLDSNRNLILQEDLYDKEPNRKMYFNFIQESFGRISRASRDPVYSTFSFKPKELGPFEVRVTRINTFSDVNFRTFDDLTLYQLSSRFDRNPIVTDKRHTFMELKIKATNQLNGTIQDLSANLFSILEVYNGSSWVKQPSNNPAWVFADLMTGQVNPRAIDKSRLDTNSLVEWANYCDEVPDSPTGFTFVDPRFTCNFVLDFDTTLQQMVEKVCNAGQASLNIIEGNYGVLLDKKKTVPVQVFTPRNSSNFSSSRAYSEQPHALKIRFVDPSKNWDVSTRMVYDNGYDATNATEFDELSTFGCTNSNQAWRFGRYMLAQGRLRQETITITVDFENLVCTRGDYVIFTQDTMRVGGRPARVSSVSGTQVTLDDGFSLDPSLSYGYTYRDSSGNFETSTISTVIDGDTFDLAGPIPDPGDLIIIGEVGKITFDCIVKSINPVDELSAELTLVEKADAIYDAESTTEFTEYDPFLTAPSTEDSAPGPVTNLEVTANDYRVRSEAYEYFIEIDWGNPAQGSFESFEIYVDRGNGLSLVNTSRDTIYEYIVDPGFLGIEHEFRVLAVSPTGAKIPLLEAPSVTATPLRKTERPDDVAGLFINITDEVLQLEWTDLNASDVDEFLIRYSPLTSGATWEASIPLSRVSGNSTTTSVQARVGTYLIKAIDFEQNQSENAALAVTTIPELFQLNAIETINDGPNFLGTKERTVLDGNAVMLQNKVVGGVTTNEYFPDGYYYYNNFLDLGEIYSVRLQSAVLAEGFTVEDLMANWVTLSDVDALANSKFSEWDVEAQVRYTAAFNVMSDWASLDAIDPISEGVQDLWSDWKKFIMGDFTGRIFQFRLKLISNKASVTPRVFDAEIIADMPDRDDVYNNIISSTSGTDVVYTPAFAGPSPSPNIQITQDDAQNGDYYKITNRSLSKFTITFYDSTDTPVSRQFDTAVRGYGRKQNQIS